MKIGSVVISTPLALAPMAGVPDLAFRTICRELGAGYTITEMVSAKALCYQDRKTLPLLKLGENEHPAAVQLFGCKEEAMERGAAKAAEYSGADVIDINMGCPMPKICNNGEGSGLARDPEKAAKVAAAVVRGAGGKPVTVKMRLGWDRGSINCVEFAKAMEEAGVSARIINLCTIKPLDEELVLKAAKDCGKVITCEEHSVIGGLGEAVCALLSEKCPTPVRRIGVNDEFGHSGPAAALLKQFGLSAEHIVEVARDFCGK